MTPTHKSKIVDVIKLISEGAFPIPLIFQIRELIMGDGNFVPLLKVFIFTFREIFAEFLLANKCTIMFSLIMFNFACKLVG